MKSAMAEIQKDRWVMSESYLNAFVKKVENLDLSSFEKPKPKSNHDMDDGYIPSISYRDGDKAIIQVSGMLLKSKPFWFDMMDIVATEFNTIKSAIVQAQGNDLINEIVLLVESGGGQVGGTKELADFIYKSDMDGKPIRAFIQDMGASGAYWLASSCRDITANHNGEVGSIGVYVVIEDTSKAAEDAGVKVHVIKNGAHKGDFTDGTEVTDDQIGEMQSIIDGLAMSFHEAVARGRDMSIEEVQELGTGSVWLASQARELGLIDDVNSLDNYLGGVDSDPINLISHGEKKMAEKTEEIVEEVVVVDQDAIKAEGVEAGKLAEQKRFKDLKESFPENEAFATAQYEAGASVEDSKLAYLDVLKSELEEAKAENVELKAVANNSTSTTGADAVASGEADPKPKSEIEEAREYKAANGGTIGQALSVISRRKRG